MDPRRNPYAPGAGAPPPELAGRDRLIETASIALDRIRNGLAAQSLLMVGLRGVGKTVLLNRICHAMAALGAGPHRSGGVAQMLGKSVRAVAPTRAKLIRKGMVYSPAHGDTAFTVPLFDEYLQRIMPDAIGSMTRLPATTGRIR